MSEQDLKDCLNRIAIATGAEPATDCYMHAEESVDALVKSWNDLNDICDALHAEPPTGWLVISQMSETMYTFFVNYGDAQEFHNIFGGTLIPQYSTPLTRTKE